MTILAVGTIAYDSVETPAGTSNEQLGGSGVYFSLSASYFSNVTLMGVIGKDFKGSDISLLKSHKIDTSGIKTSNGNTFRWKANYNDNINNAITLETQLNVLKNFDPEVNVEQSNSEYLFLANIDPKLQNKVLHSMSHTLKFSALDTMDFWINNDIAGLKNIISQVDTLIINESEAKQITDEPNLSKAAIALSGMGPQIIIIKLGEYGVSLFASGFKFIIPAFPIENIVDPTGAGDSFAGGFMGYLHTCPDISENALRNAVVCGNVMASFTVEDFGTKKIRSLSMKEILQRFNQFWELTKFERDFIKIK
ncbi:MAG: sugar kinase [SAR202 cluster bacterium]|nr:sugar kinase [Chloroflexota bacterium]MDP7612923.1 PfkB family carbohydrate kinase [Dehalococcoidia bacterium]MQG46463.1 sugar kinase [SAR202 cluster bacterium]